MSISYPHFMELLSSQLERMRDELAEQRAALAKIAPEGLAHELTWSSDLLKNAARYEVFNSIHSQLQKAPAHLGEEEKLSLVTAQILRETCTRGKWVEASTNPLDNFIGRARLAAYSELALELL